MSLTEQQLELLSAHLDGETTAAEEAVVQELLKQPQAKQYLSELEQTRLIVSRHALVKAPAGLDQRVLAAIKPAKVHQLPTATWRTPLYAIAAALVVALGIMFGPSLFSPDAPTSSEIAREVIERPAPRKPAGSGSETEAVEFSKGPGTNGMDATEKLGSDLESNRRSLDEQWSERSRDNGQPAVQSPVPPSAPEESAKTLKKAGTKDDPAGSAEDENKGNYSGGMKRGAARAPGENAPASGKVADEKPKDTANAEERQDRDKRKEEAGAESETEKPRHDSNEEGAESAAPARESEKKSDDELEDAQDGDATPRPRVAGGRGQGGAAGGGAAAAEPQRTVTLKPGKASGAVVELLWIAALHGAQAAIEEDGEHENVKIEIAEDGLDALLLAVKRLSDAQGYNAENHGAAERKDHEGGFNELMPPKPAVGERKTTVLIRVR